MWTATSYNGPQTRMTSALCWRFGSFLLIDLVMITSSTKTGQSAAMDIFSQNVIIPPRPEASIHQHHHHRRHRDHRERIRSGQLRETPHIVFHTQNERPELESLRPVRLEIEPGEKRWVMSARTFLGLETLIPEQINISPGAEIAKKPMRHPTGHKVLVGHVIMDGHDKGKTARMLNDESPTEPVFPTTTFGSFISAVTSSADGEPSTRLTPTSKPQVRSYSDTDVTPTLNMALFDWTDYEDMRPAEKQLNKRTKWIADSDVQPNKSTSSENVTFTSNEKCKHHLDCQPGSCCNLRNHTCDIHNRGLNNKCYDNCMCEEGLRCFAKLHRNDHIKGKKGQCVDPEGVNLNHGMFIVV
ncbi:draxin isoform X2 [Triplophysa dalaica]|uniref:draxin isoform X2 n=1 Tax=Triplophysa dalaica TaxID=1582913 RepID=UPI0024DF54EB|nr:draxin isoform X2 [Triplophysa dalaica]